MKKCVCLIIAIVLTLAVFVAAQEKSLYTPHQYQQNDWFLEFGENTAQYVNPASIAENDQIEFALGIFSTLEGKAGQEIIAAVHPFDYNHSVGFTYFENGARLDGDAPDYIENAFQLGYAYRFGPKMPMSHQLAVGINIDLLQFNLFDLEKFISYGVDVGLSYNPVSNSQFGHLQFGLAVQNLLQPKVKRTQTTGAAAGAATEYNIPRNLNTSMFWRAFNRKLELAGSFSVINLLETENDIGVKYFTSARLSYFLSPMLGIKFKINKQQYPVIGGTVKVKRINLFRYLQLDVDISHDELAKVLGEDHDRGFALNIKFTSRVGPTREERIGAARYRRLKLEPEEAYREAMRLYLARKFLLAAYAFGKVITKYPAFHLVDLAAFYKGKSFENLRMHTAARDVYRRAIKKYTMSDTKPRYIFQLMNIDYKENKHNEASEKYQLISNLYKESDIKPDADYVMGQIRFIQKDYSSSIRLLKPILPGNANYSYARYTLAMSYFKLKKFQEAMACMQDIMEVSPSNISEQELKDIAAVKLGHFAFDEDRFMDAAKYYAAVPSTSSKYDEALLGLAWAFIRHQRFDQAERAVDELISVAPNSFLIGEAHLLKGFCQYFNKKYDDAIKSFDKAVERSNAQTVSESQVRENEQAYSSNQSEFEEVQKRALSLSNQIPSARVLQKRDELRPDYDKIQEKIEAYIEFQSYVSKSNRFKRNRERVIQDAKFTKATVSNILQNMDEKPTENLDDLDIE